MALLKTHAEMAQLYQDIIVKILESTNATYSILGATFTKQDIAKLEEQVKYHDRKATSEASGWGHRAAADMSRSLR